MFSNEFKKHVQLIADNEIGSYSLNFYINENLPIAEHITEMDLIPWVISPLGYTTQKDFWVEVGMITHGKG